MLLDHLFQLRIPQRLLREVAVAAGEIVVYDRHGTARCRNVTGAASSCFEPRGTPPQVSWPRCLPPLAHEGAGWLPCARGAGEHLVMPVLAPATPLGWIVTRGFHRASIMPGCLESLERLLTIAVDEMRTFVETTPTPLRPTQKAVALPELIGDSAAMQRVRSEVRRVLDVPFPVLLEARRVPARISSPG